MYVYSVSLLDTRTRTNEYVYWPMGNVTARALHEPKLGRRPASFDCRLYLSTRTGG